MPKNLVYKNSKKSCHQAAYNVNYYKTQIVLYIYRINISNSKGQVMPKKIFVITVFVLLLSFGLAVPSYGQPVPPDVADRATTEVDRSFREEADKRFLF